MMPPRGDIVVITSAVQGEGKSTVTARLGSALAQAGHRTLLISADLRWPTLHERFRVPVEPRPHGRLALIERGGVSDQLIPATARRISVVEPTSGRTSTLDIVSSGTRTSEPARVMSEDALRTLYAHLRGLGYDYILVDAPPMVGVAEAQGLARLADRVFLVARPAKLTLDKVVDVEELLARIQANTLGLIVIGGRTDVSLYYGAARPAIVESAGPRTPRRTRS